MANDGRPNSRSSCLHDIIKMATDQQRQRNNSAVYAGTAAVYRVL